MYFLSIVEIKGLENFCNTDNIGQPNVKVIIENI